MNDRAQILSRWFGRTVMNSDHRFTYETAQAVIDGDASLVTKYSNGLQTPASVETGMKYRDIMVTLNRLAKILQKEKSFFIIINQSNQCTIFLLSKMNFHIFKFPHFQIIVDYQHINFCVTKS